MKILAAFFLSVFFLFFPGVPVRAQNCLSHQVAPRTYFDTVQSAIAYLEEGQNCLESHNSDLELQILNLQDELKQTEFELHTAKTRIEALEDALRTDEHITQAMFLQAGKWKAAVKPESGTSSTKAPASKPKAPASKPKAPVNKPKPAVDSLKDR